MRIETQGILMRRFSPWIWLVASIIGLGFALFWILSVMRLRAELEYARQEIAAGEYPSAKHRLERWTKRWFGDENAETEFLLGHCEKARGQPAAALAAWKRVPPNSPFAVQTARLAGELAVQIGRLTDAEEFLAPVLRASTAEASSARHLYFLLLIQEGRLDEARALMEVLWRNMGAGRTGDQFYLLREHIGLDLETTPLEGNLSSLEQNGELPTNDDRLWLVRANLAINDGRLKAAKSWLDACLEARPDDPAVWRARLDWAMAAGVFDDVRQALDYLSAPSIPPARVFTIRAWLARYRGDVEDERRILESFVKYDPGETAALDRLAYLAIRSGRTDHGREYLRRKAEVDGLKDRYHQLYKADHLDSDAREMARLAMALGRRFEAQAFLTLLLQSRPNDAEFREALAKMARDQPPAPQTSGSLAQFLAADLDHVFAGKKSLADDAKLGAVPQFVDRALSSGLGTFRFDNGLSRIHQLPEMSGGSVALFDYDGDGWMDVYLVQGGPFPGGPFTGDRLYRNRGDGTFDDVTERAGIARMPRGFGCGVAAADYDNDGDPDLFVTRWRSYTLYRNRGDGTFEDATESAGLIGDRDWPTSAAFADLDNDGDLDLYVCHYGVWDPENPRICKDPTSTRIIACDPRVIQSQPDHLFRNDGGRFVDVTTQAGIVDRDGRGLGVVAADLDGDHKIDLFVANDSTANFLFHNLGGFRFEEVAHESGAAANAGGGYQAGMGVACGDLDGDGRPDLAVTNFYGESTTLFQNLGQGLFADRTAALGLAEPSRYRLGFGVVFLDVDNDGWLDLMTANGHVYDNRPYFPYAMAAQLFKGGPGGRLTDVTGLSGPPFAKLCVGRGLASGDLDNDGRIDAVLIPHNEPPLYFHNQTQRAHFVTFRLEGTTSNRDAIGAELTLITGSKRHVCQRYGGGSYASTVDPRLHFGLAQAERVKSIEIRWPSGHVDHYGELAADRGYLLREGETVAKPLAGFRSRVDSVPAAGPSPHP